jgi:signal transduction histidine kinase
MMLGLVLCKNLVEANGGRIKVESRFGEGTTFAVILPVAE